MYPRLVRCHFCASRSGSWSRTTRGRGARLGGMANESELLINVDMGTEPTVVIGSNQNGMWSVVLFYIQDTSSLAPPANRQCLNHPCNQYGTR